MLHFRLCKNEKKNLNLKVVNSADFQLFKICQILLFLYSLEYKLIWVEILYVGRMQYSLHPGSVSDFFGTFKYDFRVLQNKRLCVARALFVFSDGLLVSSDVNKLQDSGRN